MRVTRVSSLLLVFGLAGCQPDPTETTGEGAQGEARQAALASQAVPDAEPQSTLDCVPGSNLRFLQVDVTAAPAGLDGWSPFGLSDAADVYGDGFSCNAQGVCLFVLLRRSPQGRFVTVARNFVGNDVNAGGDVGGCVIDPVTQASQAAIARASGRIELIPKLPGETSSCVDQLSNNRIAVVTSVDQASTVTVYVWDRGRILPFTVADATITDINDRAQITGIIQTPGANRAYRFDAFAQTTTVLEPVPPDPNAWGMAINQAGDVLGYSFTFDGTERIGHWNLRNLFEVSFVEGTPQFPTVSNQLVWNERGVIIISFSLNDPNTYLVPRPGVRLALADLVINGPTDTTLFVFQENNSGDFVATSQDDGRSFLYLHR